VNTFLQVSESRSRPCFQRSQTAPVTGEGLKADDEQEAGQDGDADTVSEGSRKEVIEESSEATNMKTLQAMRTLNNRFETPDPWTMEVLCKSLEELGEELGETPDLPNLPDLPARATKPRLIHSATPDRWEWEAMAMEEKMNESRSQPAPAFVQPSVQPVPNVQPVQRPQLCIPQAQPTVGLLAVPVAVALPQVGTPPRGSVAPASQGTDYPRLLGSISPASQGSPKPTSPSLSPRTRPGSLETISLDEDRELVKWYVDGAKFDSNSERLLSPEFQLRFPGHSEPFNFRMVVLATQTGGKHGAGFKKAKGRGGLELKCLSTLPAGIDSVTCLVSIGEGIRKQSAPKPIDHNFGDKTCCQLKNGDEMDWDFKQSLCRDSKSCEISVEIHL